jgi:hypothetical protein
MNDLVHALAVFDDQLIASGNFTLAGGTSVNRIACWNGATWSAVGGGTGMNNYVYALAVYNGELIAGGAFTNVSGVSVNRIARWNGTSWTAVGSGTGINSDAYALTVYNGELIAGGAFTAAGGVTANRIAGWNGTYWQPLSTGMNDLVHALTVYNSELIAGGSFTTAGGNASTHWARWGPIGPAIVEQPTNQIACPDEVVTFTVAATGSGATSHQWRRRDMNLTDGPRITGTNTNILTLAGILDSGPYDCVITDECGTTISQSARISLCPDAVGSIDGSSDGQVDGRDLGPLVSALTDGKPENIEALVYDMNGDGVVDAADVEPVVARLLSP